MVVIRNGNVSPFVKVEIILPHPCFSLDLIANKHCGTWSSMIKGLSKVKNPTFSTAITWSLQKKMFWVNVMLSHWPCFTWKFFMIWFNKILKLIFRKQPSCPRNICTEHWRRLPNLTAFLEIFLYLKNKNSVEHV